MPKQFRLKYADGTKYAHLSAAAFPQRYPTREVAEDVRGRCVAPGDIEIVEAENPHEIRGNGVSTCKNGSHNKAAPGGASTPLIQGPRRSSKEID